MCNIVSHLVSSIYFILLLPSKRLQLISYKAQRCCFIALSKPKVERGADYRADSHPRNGTTSPAIRGESVSCRLSFISIVSFFLIAFFSYSIL